MHIPTSTTSWPATAARDDYLGIFEGTGRHPRRAELQRQPAAPQPGHRPTSTPRTSAAPSRLAALLGQNRVVTMSGLPGGEPGAHRPELGRQRLELRVPSTCSTTSGTRSPSPFWKEIDALAADPDVKVAIEMHPQNIVFNTADDAASSIELTGATHVGAEMDAEPPVLAEMDPVAAVARPRPAGLPRRRQGRPDQRGQRRALRRAGRPASAGCRPTRTAVEPRRRRVGQRVAEELGLGLRRPRPRPRRRLLDRVPARAAARSTPTWLVNIEHEDTSLGRIEGLQVAADVLLRAAAPANR